MVGVLGAPNPSMPGVQGVLAPPTPVPAFGSNAPGQPPTQQPFALRQPYFAGPPQPDFAAQPPANGQLPNQAAPGEPQPPAPTYGQTIATIRHFNAAERAILSVLEDPSTGKADVKRKIVDATAELVADGITTTPEAVEVLGTVPTRPFEQKQWLEQKFIEGRQSTLQVVMDYIATNPGGARDKRFDRGNHIGDMKALYSQYAASGAHVNKKRAQQNG